MVAKPEIARPPIESSPPHPLRMTWEEFLNYNAEDFYAEWVNGEIMLLNAPGDEHQQLISFFDIVLNLYALHTGAGTVRIAPFVVRLANSGRHPDVMFISTANLGRIQPQYMDGAPDIIVEIISPSTRAVDERDKHTEYEAAGVREYWQMDYERQHAAFHRLGEDGRYHLVALTDGVFHSEALSGFRLNVSWLWDNPISHVPEALRELGVM